MDLASAFYERLTLSDELNARLSVYEGQPAVFTGEVPEDARLRRYIVTDANEFDEPFDTKTTAGRTIDRMVRCYVVIENEDDPMSMIEDIAERARTLFHRRPLPVDGYGTFITYVVDGPIPAPTDSTLYGRRLTVRLVMSQEA